MCMYVKAVIYNANTQTPTSETHIYYFSTPHTGPPQTVVSTQKSVASPSPVESSELDSASWKADIAKIQTAVAQMKGCTYFYSLHMEKQDLKAMDSKQQQYTGVLVWGLSAPLQ